MQNVELIGKRGTMFRFSLIVCISLIFGITAKPYKPWNEVPDEAVQDAVVSIDGKGKLSWKVEVEPPEDITDTLYDIDPNMMIWKSMTGSNEDELQHPSVADLVKVQMQNLDTLPSADIQAEPLQEVMKSYQEAEEDRDHIDHPVLSDVASHYIYNEASDELDRYLAPLTAEYKAGAQARVAHSEPEKDEDDLYHRDSQVYLQPAPPVQMELLKSEVRIHFEPEEDMDALYHKDVPQLSPYQAEFKADAPVFLTSQRKHSEPEEDLDGIYHQ